MKEVIGILVVLRGGSCSIRNPNFCRSSRRLMIHSSCFSCSSGFRVVRVPKAHQVKKGDKGDGK
jgi:formylglycine-generating enzyme required for sulfatase activity